MVHRGIVESVNMRWILTISGRSWLSINQCTRRSTFEAIALILILTRWRLSYIHELHKVTKVKEISSAATIWTLYYTFTPPISPRIFTVLQVVHLSEETPRTGYVVSLLSAMV